MTERAVGQGRAGGPGRQGPRRAGGPEGRSARWDLPGRGGRRGQRIGVEPKMTLRTRRIANRPTTRPSIPRSRGWVDCTVSFPRPTDRLRPIRACHVPRRWAPVASPEDARAPGGVTQLVDRGVGVRAPNVTGAPPPQVAGLLRPRCPLTRRRGGSATGFLSRCRRDIPSPQATGWFLDGAKASSVIPSLPLRRGRPGEGLR